MTVDEYSAQLLALRRDYSARLPQRMRELESRFTALTAGWDPAAGQELRRLVHNLAGSGASYGLPEVSSRAKDVERALDAALVTATPPAPEIEAIGTALRALGRVVAGLPAG